jgi:hypothetical protein
MHPSRFNRGAWDGVGGDVNRGGLTVHGCASPIVKVDSTTRHGQGGQTSAR